MMAADKNTKNIIVSVTSTPGEPETIVKIVNDSHAIRMDAHSGSPVMFIMSEVMPRVADSMYAETAIMHVIPASFRIRLEWNLRP